MHTTLVQTVVGFKVFTKLLQPLGLGDGAGSDAAGSRSEKSFGTRRSRVTSLVYLCVHVSLHACVRA